ncbi:MULTISPECIES: hypothetical protein [Cyanophyceae]|uniref:hypothetical protein n=1 Tax=Cyanophyceae TaxID=3028117 RepID=UPI00168A1ACE|nr:MULTISPECIES: hypothetical protein [Cyanophyceae]MBD1914998.1 hypothetical protein [Phormidium sp. FACHB-77]MBD2032785.1 hypothetical protein [Phormidium sp. FACHB-322]MBD2049930.1 hypothetical protein [Leptolyngbya sp. FACHB-60]
MKFLYSPNGAYLFDNLIDLLRNQERHNNLVVDATFNELVKETMLEKAQFERLTDVALLSASLDLVTQNLDSELKARGVEVDFSSYSKDAQNRLKFAAKEIASLAAAAHGDENHRQVPEPLVSAQGIPFQLQSLRMGSQFNGLHAFAVETATFDLEALQKKYPVEGDWFPATIFKNDFLFIVDYSSILVNLSNLSNDHWPKAKDQLIEIMDYLRPA